MTEEEQVAATSALAAHYCVLTGVPIIVTPNQMRFFRDNGVDCTHLLEVGQSLRRCETRKQPA